MAFWLLVLFALVAAGYVLYMAFREREYEFVLGGLGLLVGAIGLAVLTILFVRP
ncbi:MAG: hypothetical protein AAB865_02010 [Patescibacteria group bacterium]